MYTLCSVWATGVHEPASADWAATAPKNANMAPCANDVFVMIRLPPKPRRHRDTCRVRLMRPRAQNGVAVAAAVTECARRKNPVISDEESRRAQVRSRARQVTRR